MHDIILVEHLEGVYKLSEHHESLPLTETLFLAESSFEGASVAELIHKVEVIGGFQHVDVLDYVLVLLNVCQDVYLVHSTFLQFFVLLKSAHLNYFHRVLLVVILVDGAVDLSVGSLSDDLVESVVLNYSYHLNTTNFCNRSTTDSQSITHHRARHAHRTSHV